MKLERGTITLSVIERIIAVIAGLLAIAIPTTTMLVDFGKQNQRFDDQSQALADIKKEIGNYADETKINSTDIAMIKGELFQYSHYK